MGMAHAHVVPLGGLFVAECDLRAEDFMLSICGLFSRAGEYLMWRLLVFVQS